MISMLAMTDHDVRGDGYLGSVDNDCDDDNNK